MKNKSNIQSPELSSLGKQVKECICYQFGGGLAQETPGCPIHAAPPVSSGVQATDNSVPCACGGKVSDSPPLESGDWEERFDKLYEALLFDGIKIKTNKEIIKALISDLLKETCQPHIRNVSTSDVSGITWEETFDNWFEEWIDDSGKFLKTTPLSFVKAGVGAVVSEARKSQVQHIQEKVETLPRYDVWSSPGGHDVKTEYVKLTDIEKLLED